MAIECYYKWCPYHSFHDLNEEGPFCYESECKASEEESKLFEGYRKTELYNINISCSKNENLCPLYVVTKGNDTFKVGDHFEIMNGTLILYNETNVKVFDTMDTVKVLYGIDYTLDREYFINLKNKYLQLAVNIGDLLEDHSNNLIN